MKHYFSFTLILLFALATAYGQNASKPAAPAPSTQPVKPAAYQPRDYNYTFYPDGNYKRYGTVHTIDSASQKMTIKTDSTVQGMQVVVEKEGDNLVLRGLADPTAIHYRESVKYIGITTDGTNTLVYRANSKDQETIFVNPILGYVVIGFKICDKKYATKESDCDANFHYFGNIAARKYMP